MTRLKHLTLIALAILSFSNLKAQQTWITKVHESVLESLSKNSETDVLVLMRAQADVSAAENLEEKSNKGAYVFNVLTATATNSQKDITQFLKVGNIKFQSLWLVNAIYIPKANSTLVENLAARSDVAEIINNPKSHTELNVVVNESSLVQFRSNVVSWGITKIKADSAWALGYRGQNAVVGGADTGYDWLHPALKPKYRGTLLNGTFSHDYNWHDAIHADTAKKGNPCGYDTKLPCDDDKHGTHTMGTMVGGTDTIFTGIAPDAKWIGARNMDQGNGTLASYVECFQWFIAPTKIDGTSPNTALAPHVINNSWYCATSEGCNSSNFAVLQRALENTRAAGIVVVVSNGNAGPNCNTTDGPPAFFKKAFSVGATRIDDTIAGFSSRGYVTLDSSSRLKPDISAPGQTVYSTFPNNMYGNLSGTSMAGPHVVGLVALMISANPKLAGQVDTIESIIKQTAVPKTTLTENCGNIKGTTIPNNTYGYGRIDALAAVKRALSYRKTTTVEIATQNFKIFPNPTSEVLTLLFNQKQDYDSDILIHNAVGQVISRQKITSGVVQSVNVEQLTAGVYFLSVSNVAGLSTVRFVKL